MSTRRAGKCETRKKWLVLKHIEPIGKTLAVVCWYVLIFVLIAVEIVFDCT